MCMVPPLVNSSPWPLRLLWHQDLGATSVEALEAMLSRVKQCLGQDEKGAEKDLVTILYSR